MKFINEQEYRKWAESQSWYQSISLSCGYKTPGNIDSEKRESVLSRYDFKGKNVLDIGCNSGLYSILSKRHGAEKVVGIDINKKRIEQARIIAENEGLDVQFLEAGINSVPEMGRFDIVICIAVLTEIQDLLGSIEILKKVINEVALIEMDIAKPILYVPSKKKLFNVIRNKESISVFAEARKSKAGWMISPSLGLLKNLFGKEFYITDLGENLRYRMLEIKRI